MASTTWGLSSGACSRSDDAFVNHGYINWKDASRDKKFGLPSHEQSHFHIHCTGILALSHHDIANMMSTENEKQKAVNHVYLKKVLQNVVFLASQGLPFRGDWVPGEKEREAGAEMNSNFHQLLLLRAQGDQNILKVTRQKTRTYTDHNI